MIDQGETVGDFALDWRELEREAGSFLSSHRLRHKSPRLPGGVNFVTDELLGYWEAEDGTPALVETGMFLGARCVGVTFPRERNGEPSERDTPCWNWTEVRVALGFGDGEP